MVEPGEHKYKGLRGRSSKQGMGRLRRAMGKGDARHGGWDDKRSASALKLLAKLYSGKIDLTSLQG